MGWLQRLSDLFSKPTPTAHPTEGGTGEKLERQGQLAAAVEAYLSEGRNRDAARLLLLQADTASTHGQRLALLNQAANVAPDGSPEKQQAQKKQVLLRFQHFERHPDLALPSELQQLAHQLEQLQCLQEAAKLYQRLGDVEGQARTLGALGKVDDLDWALAVQAEDSNDARNRMATLQKIRDLDRIGERARAVELAEEWLNRVPNDRDVQRLLDGLRSRKMERGAVALRTSNESFFLLLQPSAVVGRGDEADIRLPAIALSRRHVQVSFGQHGIVLQDLDSHNGTWLAGARLAAPVQLGGPTQVYLGNQVPMEIAPVDPDTVRIKIANESYVLSRERFVIDGRFALQWNGPWLELHAIDPSSPPILGDMAGNAVVQLALGDIIRARRGGPPVIEVLQP